MKTRPTQLLMLALAAAAMLTALPAAADRGDRGDRRDRGCDERSYRQGQCGSDRNQYRDWRHSPNRGGWDNSRKRDYGNARYYGPPPRVVHLHNYYAPPRYYREPPRRYYREPVRRYDRGYGYSYDPAIVIGVQIPPLVIPLR